MLRVLFWRGGLLGQVLYVSTEHVTPKSNKAPRHHIQATLLSVPGGLFYQENDQIYAPSFSVQFEEKKSGVVRVAGVRCAVAHLLCDALSGTNAVRVGVR